MISMIYNNSLGNKKKSLFIWISRCEMFRGILQIPPRGWFPEIFVLIQMAGAGAREGVVEITIFAIFDVFSLPCTRL